MKLGRLCPEHFLETFYVKKVKVQTSAGLIDIEVRVCISEQHQSTAAGLHAAGTDGNYFYRTYVFGSADVAEGTIRQLLYS